VLWDLFILVGVNLLENIRFIFYKSLLHVKGLIEGSHTLLRQKEFQMKLIKSLGITALASVASFAADVNYSEATGFTGVFNLTPFYSAVAIIVVAIGVVASIKLALGMFKKVA